MDEKASSAYNALERMLSDATKRPMKLPLSLLEAITNNFSEERVLGTGGFAVVYKGMIGSESIAVKKLLETFDMDEGKFTKEIQCLMKLRHKNVVRFLGYCYETQGEIMDCDGKPIMADRRNRLLCFEFVRNGTLQRFITDASCGLEWGIRYDIIKGICEGLHYLHEKRIVHSDLKPANILLDDNMLPKIADFGLSRCFDEKQSKAITSKLIGSLGYLPPEFFYGQITLKLDIFSLGVIINEILTGKKEPSTEKNVLESWNNRLQISERDILLQQVSVNAEIAKMCIDPDKGNRPTIHRIIEMFKELGSACKFDEAGASTTLGAQMDGKASSTAEYNVLERMLLDEKEKPTKLPLSLLKTITNNFSEEREVGRGGFSVVYKGMLVNGMVVAVKKLSKKHDVHGEKFDREVQCLSKVQHKNIVRFLGYCTGAQGEMANLRKRLLCFEFVPNGSLDEYITDASCGLEWRARYQIIKGICEGLHYLHEKRIVHLDIKPPNILLHDNMVPKIADLGISRFLDGKESKTVASKLIGTVGYLAPEFYNGEITFKLDIYSLGVLIIEILTGKRNQNGCSTVQVLESWTSRLDLSQDTLFREVRACAEIGRMCTDANPESRPTTQDIIKKFEELESADGFEAGASTSSVAQLIGLRKSREGQKGMWTSFASHLSKLIAPRMRRYHQVIEATGLKEFSFEDLICATKNFDPSHCIGEDMFGKVYKGTFRLTTGHEMDLAVKRVTNQLADKYQHTELRILANINHRNVVPLVGFSRKGKKLYTCHEFLSKGSLDNYLPGLANNQCTPLRWSTRYEIIRGICAGLHCLHELCNNAISHMDLKPSNILLDERMMPKIANFGLSRVIGNINTHTCTIIGTNGYMAPEFTEYGCVSCKCDIYSLGVLIMGIVMGEGPSYMRDPCGARFIKSVRRKFIFEAATTTSPSKCSARDRAQLKSEASLQDDDCLEDVEKCIGLALQCVDEDPEKRPLATYIYGRLPIATLLLTDTPRDS